MAGNESLQILSALITQNRGARFEADIFMHLVGHPHVLRSFEFAPIDGAIDCSMPPLGLRGTYSERLWDLEEFVNETYNEIQIANGINRIALVLFDAKSKISGCAEDQIYSTTIKQRQLAQFYICICAGNPSYVEVFPNYYAGASTALDNQNRDVAINLSQKSIVEPCAYGYLSPCNAPYRMPLDLLAQAISRIRDCILDPSKAYVNPYTETRFPNWKPTIVPTNKYLVPHEESQHGSGYSGIVNIWKGIRTAKAKRSIAMDFEFICLQPRLADFKLLVNSSTIQATRRQALVQYKIDSVERARDNFKIAIGRNTAGKIRWYFTDTERFDFLWYEFRYRNSSNKALYKFFFFIPERELPDIFFTSTDLHAILDPERFASFSTSMDEESMWVDHVERIINRYPSPRQTQRPTRGALTDIQSATSDPTEADNSSETENTQDPAESARVSRDLRWFSVRFYERVMAQCALQRQGLLVVLSRQYPLADFAFARYQWTKEEVHNFLQNKQPPRTISQLAPRTPLVLLHVYTKYRAGTSRGPMLTPVEFKRLDAWTESRLLFFDMFGMEGKDVFGPLIAIPSEDISISTADRDRYESNLAKNTKLEYMTRSPLLTQQIHREYHLADYTLSTVGPMIFEDAGNRWLDIWKLLNTSSGTDMFSHPPGARRMPDRFQVTLQCINQRLADYHASIEGQQLLKGK